MSILSDIIYGVSLVDVVGATDIEVSNVQIDSRKVEQGSCFIAVKGFETDGHRYINNAIDQGATSIICEEIPNTTAPNVTYVLSKDTKDAAGKIASNFYGNPSAKLFLAGVTGTNGKTTITTLAFNLFRSMGYKVGLLSTIENRIDSEVVPSTHTTPDPVSLNKLLAEMVEAGCGYCFMEVSSHAVHQQRIAGLEFNAGIFTNISRDHLDYHKTFPEYIKAKKAFFDGLDDRAVCIINADDKNGALMGANTRARVYTYGIKKLGTFHGKILENSFQGLLLSFQNQEFNSLLIGAFNASNLLALYALTQVLGIDEHKALLGISALNSAEGRFQYLKSPSGKLIGIVDYAHTPDALEKVLSTINEIRANNENVITIVGCGGDRDKGKRPQMAEVACKFSDKVILTSDNPRSEDPKAIIDDMLEGVKLKFPNKVLTQVDRAEAIKTAVMLAEEGDILLVAGKGHEKYQEIDGVKTAFDDREQLMSSFKTLNK